MSHRDEALLSYMRQLALEMHEGRANWQWIGRHMSQRMFGITEHRAKYYASAFGGEAREMEE